MIGQDRSVRVEQVQEPVSHRDDEDHHGVMPGGIPIDLLRLLGGVEKIAPRGHDQVEEAVVHLQRAGRDQADRFQALAYHFELAGDIDKARHYYRSSASAVAERGAAAEAERMFLKFFELTPDDDPSGVAVKIEYANRVLVQSGRAVEAETVLLDCLHHILNNS